MKKLSKTLSHLLEYALLRSLTISLTIIPRKQALMLGSFFGTLLHAIGFYRQIVKKNMDYVGIWNATDAKRITRELYGNLGRYAVDFLRPSQPLPEHTIYNYESIAPLLCEGKGCIAILGHLGNWEMLATAFTNLPGKLHVVAKPMHNPYVDKWLLAKRTSTGVTTIYSNQALRKMISVIRADGIIAILIDQFMRNHGNPVPFMGKMSKTVSTVAGLSVKTGCNVISVCATMSQNGTYEIQLFKIPEEPRDAVSDEEKILAAQTLHNRILSDQIIAYPAHWFGWFHKRFRGYVDYSKKTPQ